MKKLMALLMAMVMLLALTGCGSEEELAAKQAEVERLEAKLAALENAPAVNKIHAVNATVNGKTVVEFEEEDSFTATAALEEGMLVDHWVLNGEIQPDSSANTFTFNADKDTVVIAVGREEKKLTTINAEIRFLNADKVAAGDPLTEFVFEQDYVNPITNEACEGGKISAEIKAVVPFGKKVDYWMINGVPYHHNPAVSSFIVEDLDETTTYEVVLKDIPITYYNVTCTGCTFNGMSSSRVPAGTVLTFVANGGYTSRFYVNGGLYVEYRNAISVQINGDTVVECYTIIN